MRILVQNPRPESLCTSFRLDHVTVSGPITVGGWDTPTGLTASGAVFCLSARGGVQILKHMGLCGGKGAFPSAEVGCKMVIHE